jgi:peptidoglycan/LPS O-acetylase OafA/YrhL
MKEPIQSPGPDYWACLAATRFVLASIVLFGHMNSIGVGGALTESVYEYGELAAVVGFFIISGFSIANSITQRPRRYIARRLWRIWPTYLFSFICCTLPATWAMAHKNIDYYGKAPVTAGLIIGNLFMLQGLLVRVLETNAVTWTLAIEECYYLLAPAFRRCMSWGLVPVIFASAFFYAKSGDFGWTRFASATRGASHLCFIWAWLLGFLFYRHRRSTWARVLLFLLPVWLFRWNQLGGHHAGFTLLAATLVIAYADELTEFVKILPPVLVELEYTEGKTVRIKWPDVRNFLVFLGNLSFPLYIIHLPVAYLLKAAGCMSLPLHLLAIFSISVLVYFFIDKPNRGRWRSGDATVDPELCLSTR